MSIEQVNDTIDRIDEIKVSIEEFIEKYEIPYKPVVILNVQENWAAKEKWSLEVCICNYLSLKSIFN
jgi:histone arginine demethylase JMJD6